MITTKYTFLLPAYKITFFEESLFSIKNQTFKDFKVIVSDDSSPENIKSVYDRVVGDDNRFVYRRNEANIGSKSLVSHWNLLVDMCDTEYLIMASDDDIYYPEFLQEIDVLVQKYPKVDLLRARVEFIDELGNVEKKDGVFAEYETPRRFLDSHFSNNNLKCIANHVFRTFTLKENGGFYEMPLAWYSDQITAILMSCNGCCNTNSILFQFRLSNVNISGAKPTSKVASLKSIATMQADIWFQRYMKKNSIVDFKFDRWGKQIYYWLMDAEFRTFLFLIPKIIINGLWDRKWMKAIIQHQIKMLVTFQG